MSSTERTLRFDLIQLTIHSPPLSVKVDSNKLPPLPEESGDDGPALAKGRDVLKPDRPLGLAGANRVTDNTVTRFKIPCVKHGGLPVRVNDGRRFIFAALQALILPSYA